MSQLTVERLTVLEKYKNWMASNDINFECTYNGTKRSFTGKLEHHDGYPATMGTVEEMMLTFFLHHCQEEIEIIRDENINDIVIIPNFFLEAVDVQDKSSG